VRLEARHQFAAHLFMVAPVMFGIASRQMPLPEMVVEIEVEQGAVHVEQDGVYRVPVGFHCNSGEKSGEAQPAIRELCSVLPQTPCCLSQASMRCQPSCASAAR